MFYYGWIVVAACFLFAVFAWGGAFYGHGVYLFALEKAHGWPVSTLSLAITVFYAALIPANLAVGAAMDKYGPKWVFGYGGLALGGSVAAVGLVTAPWQLFVVYPIMATGYAALTTTAISATLVPWFRYRLSFALALALTGASVGGAVVAPGLVLLISAWGLAPAVGLVGGAIMVLSMIMAIWLLKRGPADTGQFIDGGAAPTTAGETVGGKMVAGKTGNSARSDAFSRGTVLRDIKFWFVVIPFLLAFVGQVGFLAHQVSYLAPVAGLEGAALAVSITSIAAIFGRFALSALTRHFALAPMAVAVFLVQAAALAMMEIWPTPISLYVNCALFGMMVGNLVLLPPLMVRQNFGDRAFGRIQSMSATGIYLGAAVGPGLVGFLFDATGGYSLAIWIMVGLYGLAAGIAAFQPKQR